MHSKFNVVNRPASPRRLSIVPQPLAIVMIAVLVAAGMLSCVPMRAYADTDAVTPSSYEGFAEPIADIELSTDEVGQLVDVPVTLGQRVTENQLVAQLDDRVQRAAVEVSRAQAIMDGEILAAEATRSLQAYRVEQLSQLRQGNMAGPEELRRAQMELDVAVARVQVAKEQKSLRQTELARLELQVEQRKLRAPFSGVVAVKRLSTGAAITPGNATIMRLIRTDVLIGVFNVPAEQSFTMRVGMATQVYFRAARLTVDGQIESISPAINGESGTVLVRVSIANPNDQLLPGDRLSMRITPGQDLQTKSQAAREGKVKR